MRPVRLEMEGFAAFRNATVVDFHEADYFALTGPTGSGKSTVIDAIVFALYGTAPRWGRSNAIKYALAPTSTRGTVRLVFDVGPHRYQVAREVRRVGSAGTVMQKGAFLERFLDSSAASATSEEVQTLAAEVSEVGAATEHLVGLTYEDFTQAVVLPQGKFAEFLNAKPSERRDILLKLLGADQYEAIRMAAAERQREAQAQVALATAQLGDLIEATPEAEAAHAARVRLLESLTERLERQLGALTELRDDQRVAADVYGRLSANASLLAEIGAPDDLGDVLARAEELGVALRIAREKRDEAAAAEDAAREALNAAGPRHTWERLKSQHTEMAGLIENLPSLRETAVSAAEEFERASADRATAAEGLKAAQDAVDDAGRHQQASQDRMTDAQGRRDTLASIQTPHGHADLAERHRAAQSAVEEAEQAVTEAVAQEDEARSAARRVGDGALQRRTLEQLAERAGLAQELTTLTLESESADATLQGARETTARARDAVAQAEAAAAHAHTETIAAQLRRRMIVGDDCPVCERRIDSLPTAHEAGDEREAGAAVTAAKASLREAETSERTADLAAASTAARRTAKQEALDSLHRALTAAQGDHSLESLEQQLTTQLADIEATTKRYDEASAHLAQQRTRFGDAQKAAEDMKADVEAAWLGFRAVRDSLAKWGAPATGSTDLGQAWAELAGWIEGEIAELDDTTLPRLRATHGEITESMAMLGKAAAAAKERLDEAEAMHITATKAETTAADEVARTEKREAELRQLLQDQPDEDATAVALQRLSDAEAAEAEARESHRVTRLATQEASQAHQAAQALLEDSRKVLRTARDTVVGLGAPSVDEANPERGWSELVAWAAERLIGVEEERLLAEQRQTEVAAQVAAAEEELVRTAAEHGVEVTDISRAERTVATSLADANAKHDLIREQIRKRRTLEGKLASATEDAHVATLLADSLRSNKFQQWLAGAALDLLVAAASDTLHELSGGQYGLTHEKGEFFVIDHEDAEATRSVRTLSGGETFQTSLALALALSDQLSSLSSSGAKLESLFLDEGFGTLDADSLETVAVTLERLAQGDRMVGVVTHVPALAERVPTRYFVTRDSQSSRVTREG